MEVFSTFELVAEMDPKRALVWLSRVADSLGVVGNVTATSCIRLRGHASGSAFNMTRFKVALAVGEHQMRPLRLEFSEPTITRSPTSLVGFEGFMGVANCARLQLK